MAIDPSRATQSRPSRPRARPTPGGHASPARLALDARGVVHVEYLALAAGIAIGLIAIAVVLRDTYAEGFVARSLALLGVQ